MAQPGTRMGLFGGVVCQNYSLQQAIEFVLLGGFPMILCPLSRQDPEAHELARPLSAETLQPEMNPTRNRPAAPRRTRSMP